MGGRGLDADACRVIGSDCGKRVGDSAMVGMESGRKVPEGRSSVSRKLSGAGRWSGGGGVTSSTRGGDGGRPTVIRERSTRSAFDSTVNTR